MSNSVWPPFACLRLCSCICPKSQFIFKLKWVLFVLTDGVWGNYNLTYMIQMYPDLPTSAVDEEVERAAAVWAAVTKFRFRPATNNELADIRITFASRDHGDGMPFDGRGMVVAHAFPPPSGKLHFDIAEEWTIRCYEGTTMQKALCSHISASSPQCFIFLMGYNYRKKWILLCLFLFTCSKCCLRWSLILFLKWKFVVLVKYVNSDSYTATGNMNHILRIVIPLY